MKYISYGINKVKEAPLLLCYIKKKSLNVISVPVLTRL